MPKQLVNASVLTDIANAIRWQNGEDTLYKPSEMPAAIEALDGSKEKTGTQLGYGEPCVGTIDPGIFDEIANAVRAKNGDSTEYKPEELAQAILDLEFNLGLKPRVLFLENCTEIELTYLENSKSPSGKKVALSYEINPDGYMSSMQKPWGWSFDPLTTNIAIARFDESFQNAPMNTFAGFFYGCTGLKEVYGFQYLNTTAVGELFSGCSNLVSIYVNTGYEPPFTEGEDVLYENNDLIGGTGWSPSTYSSADYTALKLGDGGALTDPENDQREWIPGKLYANGVLEFNNYASEDDPRPVLCSGSLCVNSSNIWARRFYASFAADIERVNIRNVPSFNASEIHCDNWFDGLTNLKKISGLEKLKNVVSASYMVAECPELEEIDLNKFDPSKLTDTYRMFWKDEKLQTIYADSTWQKPTLTKSEEMFEGCTKLVGGNKTPYSPEHTDGERFCLDEQESTGYLTSKTY